MATDNTAQNTNSPNVPIPSQPARWNSVDVRNWERTQSRLSPSQRIWSLITAFYEFRRDLADNPALAADTLRMGALTRESTYMQHHLDGLNFRSNDSANIYFASQASDAYLNILRAAP